MLSILTEAFFGGGKDAAGTSIPPL